MHSLRNNQMNLDKKDQYEIFLATYFQILHEGAKTRNLAYGKFSIKEFLGILDFKKYFLKRKLNCDERACLGDHIYTASPSLEAQFEDSAYPREESFKQALFENYKELKDFADMKCEEDKPPKSKGMPSILPSWNLLILFINLKFKDFQEEEFDSFYKSFEKLYEKHFPEVKKRFQLCVRPTQEDAIRNAEKRFYNHVKSHNLSNLPCSQDFLFEKEHFKIEEEYPDFVGIAGVEAIDNYNSKKIEKMLGFLYDCNYGKYSHNKCLFIEVEKLKKMIFKFALENEEFKYRYAHGHDFFYDFIRNKYRDTDDHNFFYDFIRNRYRDTDDHNFFYDFVKKKENECRDSFFFIKNHNTAMPAKDLKELKLWETDSFLTAKLWKTLFRTYLVYNKFEFKLKYISVPHAISNLDSEYKYSSYLLRL